MTAGCSVSSREASEDLVFQMLSSGMSRRTSIQLLAGTSIGAPFVLTISPSSLSKYFRLKAESSAHRFLSALLQQHPALPFHRGPLAATIASLLMPPAEPIRTYTPTSSREILIPSASAFAVPQPHREAYFVNIRTLVLFLRFNDSGDR